MLQAGRPGSRWEWLATLGIQTTPELIKILDDTTDKLAEAPSDRDKTRGALKGLAAVFYAAGVSGDALAG